MTVLKGKFDSYKIPRHSSRTYTQQHCLHGDLHGDS